MNIIQSEALYRPRLSFRLLYQYLVTYFIFFIMPRPRRRPRKWSITSADVARL